MNMNPSTRSNNILKSPKSNRTFSQFSDAFNTFKNFESQDIFLPVRLKSDKRDDWIRELKINISISGYINLAITDSDDPVFLYKAQITETDFHQIKQTQNLLIEYQQFPNKLVEMLETCKESLHSNSILKQNSSFNCVLEERQIGDGDLLIQETTQLRNLVHLRLAVKIPNDTILKKHVSGLCKDYKAKYESASDEIKKLSEQIDSLSSKVNQYKDELLLINQNKEIELKDLHIKYNKELTEIKEKHSNEVQSMTSNHDEGIRSSSQSYETRIKELEKENSSILESHSKLKQEHKELSDRHEDLIRIRENTNKEISHLKVENENLKEENRELNRLKYSNEKTMTELNVKLDLIKSQLSDKDSNVGNLNNLVESLQNAKVNTILH